jgi:hypothetical protein
MPRLVWIAILFAFSGWAFAYYETGRELMRNCESNEAPRWALCRGFLTGIADSVTVARAEYPDEGTSPILPTFSNVCKPDDVTRGKLVKVWIDWANQHPERLREPAVTLVMAAFAEAWPCN